MSFPTSWTVSPRVRLRPLQSGAIEILEPDLESAILTDTPARVLRAVAERAPLGEIEGDTEQILASLAACGVIQPVDTVGPACTASTHHAAHDGLPRVEVVGLDLDAAPIIAALEARGVSCIGRATREDVLVLLTEDLAIARQPPATQAHATAVAQTHPGFGWITWLEQDRTACPVCLWTQVRLSTFTLGLIDGRLPQPCLPADQIAAAITEGLTARAWTAPRPVLAGLPSRSETHPVRPLPGCPECGRPSEGPPPLQSRPKPEGSHRATSLAQAEALARPLADPVTGIVHPLPRKTLSSTFDPSPAVGLHVNMVRIRPALPPRSLPGLLAAARRTATGTGTSALAAWLAAWFEGIERFCGHVGPHVLTCHARPGDLDGPVVLPNQIALFRQDQFDTRDVLNEEAHPFLLVPEPFDPDVPTSWTSATDLTHDRRQVWVPTGSTFYGYSFEGEPRFAYANSNGCAAGSCYEEAILYALLELVERDAIALWMLSRALRPGVDLDALDDPLVQAARAECARRGRRLDVLDVTTDLGIPTYAAVSRRLGGQPGYVLGFGCHLDGPTAVQKAVREAFQMLPATDGFGGTAPTSPLDWAETASPDEHPYLSPDPAASLVDARTRSLATPDVLDDLEIALARARRAGLDVLVVDQTHPAVGIPVVRVVVPGLLPPWRRWGGARLSTIPHLLKWVHGPIHPERSLPMTL